jgi:hypothetical protein
MSLKPFKIPELFIQHSTADEKEMKIKMSSRFQMRINKAKQDRDRDDGKLSRDEMKSIFHIKGGC